MTDNELIPKILNLLNNSGVFNTPVDFNTLDTVDDSIALVVAKPTAVTPVLGGENRLLQLKLVYRVVNQTIGLEGIDIVDKLEKAYSVLYNSKDSLGVEQINLTSGASLNTAYENGVLDFGLVFTLEWFNDRAIIQEDN